MEMKSAAKVMAFWISIQLQIGCSFGQSTNQLIAFPEKFSLLNPVFRNHEKPDLHKLKRQRITVLISLSEICMVSRYYALEMQNLSLKFQSDSVLFGGYFPNPFSSASSIREFGLVNKLTFPLFKDSLAHFSIQHSITTTPEVLVFKDGIKLYQGRFDDFYVAVGRQRGFTRMRFLENALNKILNNEKPGKTYIKPVGCLIDFRLWKF